MADGADWLTLGRGIRAAAARCPATTALIDADGARLTYRELTRRMARVANMARGHFAIERGDRVALIAANRLEYIELVIGLADAGAMVATLSPALTLAELRAIFDDCEPRLVIADEARADIAQLAAELDLPFIALGAAYEALLGAASDAAPPSIARSEDPFALAYTSGTTGKPKGVLLPHRSRALTFMAMAEEYRCFSAGETFLAMAPMCHGAGFVFASAGLFFGGTTELFPGNDMAAMLERLSQGGIDGVFVVPTQLSRLFALAPATLDRFRRPNLGSIISNAAALSQSLKERAIDQFGEGLLNESYGSTEAGIVTNIGPADLRARPGSVGKPFPLTEIELRRDDGSPADPGEAGELFSRSPASFLGYWRNPEETAVAMRDGWVSAGDIATVDADGYYRIVDRKKDMVVTGGLNVYPSEIEAVIAAMAGVTEVAVVGRPSPEWGERLHAFVVTSAVGSEDQVIEHCRAQLAGFKVPRGVTFIDRLPRNAGGKVVKSDLRDRSIR